MQEYTEVTDVGSVGGQITVYLGRERHYITPGDTLTFVGDSHDELFENGEEYEFVGKTGEEPMDSVAFEPPDGDRVRAYNEDVRYYLLNGGFKIHGA